VPALPAFLLVGAREKAFTVSGPGVEQVSPARGLVFGIAERTGECSLLLAIVIS
jgi:hypothetical protein